MRYITTSLPLRLHYFPHPIFNRHCLRQRIDQLHRLDAHPYYLPDQAYNIPLIIYTIRIALNAASFVLTGLVLLSLSRLLAWSSGKCCI
jgi:hypothetical protein